jgi:hypothetical protein
MRHEHERMPDADRPHGVRTPIGAARHLNIRAERQAEHCPIRA